MSSLLEIMDAIASFLEVPTLAQERLMDAAALAKAQQLRQSGKMPQVTYRCQQRRCGGPAVPSPGGRRSDGMGCRDIQSAGPTTSDVR